MKKKILVIGVVSIFLMTSLATLPGVGIVLAVTKEYDDPIIEIDPEDPNGRPNSGWYITPVEVTFYAKDDIQLYYIYWRIITNGVEGPWTREDVPRDPPLAEWDYTVPLNVDGSHTLEFQAEDHVGNVGPIHSSSNYAGWPNGLIRIDMTPPTVTLTKEKINIIEYKFTANVDDATSGDFGAVEFYLDDEFQTADSQLPYEYPFKVNPLEGFEHTITVKAFDLAGNTASDSNSTTFSRFSQQFTKSFFRHFPLLERLLYLSIFTRL